MKGRIFKTITVSIVLFFTITLLKSCAVAALTLEPMSFQKETAKKGLILGSITFPKEIARYNAYYIRISALDSIEKIARKKSREIHISPEWAWRIKHRGQLDNGLTYLFAIYRPEGKYEVSSIRLFTNSSIQALQRTDYSGSFSIPFDVVKGEITYVGNIFYNEYAGRKDTFVTYRNNYEKDIEAIKKIQPSVDWSKAMNDVNRKIDFNKVNR